MGAMEKAEIMEMAIGEVAKSDPVAGKAMEGRMIADTLRKLLEGKIEVSGVKRPLKEVLTEKVLKGMLENPKASDLKIINDILKDDGGAETGGSGNATDRKLAELARGKQ